ncbi:hypothetical protein E4U13_007164 [Claviceps humidiphila]|uniref:Uncharacterized protein n=1 Tax=Claviceps humidiphila TaxID=1294629 RepID=A0A9P7TSW9_9HYPO|nr:hypothetical protein E4U13_007164 [Claviceps humidiphila]
MVPTKLWKGPRQWWMSLRKAVGDDTEDLLWQRLHGRQTHPVGILGSLLPIESGEHHSTFAAQQSDDDAEGSATAELAAGDIPGVSPAVQSLLLKLGSALTSFTFFTMTVKHANLSRKEYKAIVEALEQVALVEELRGLPDYADTLRHRFLGSLPLLTMRRTTLTLDKKKIESRKTDKEDLLMFDLESVIARYLSSARNQTAMWPAHRTNGIVDHFARLNQWWGESIRTTSGHCVKMDDDTVLFLSDFDFTDTAIQAGTSGSHVIEIQAVHEKANLNDDMFATKPELKYLHYPEGVAELIVVEDERLMRSLSRVHSRHINVHIDYGFKPTRPETFSLSN